MKKSVKFMLLITLVLTSVLTVTPVFAQSHPSAGTVVAAQSIQSQTPIELPNELATIITLFVGGGITWLVVNGIKGLVEAFGGNLDGIWGKIATALAAVISGGAVATLIGVINTLLGFIPPDFAPMVQQVLALLVTIFGSMGIQRTWKQSQTAKAQ